MTGAEASPNLSITLRADPAASQALHAWLDEVFTARPASSRHQNAVRLCLEEVVMNTLMHGYGNENVGDIMIAIEPDGAGLRALVVDSAPPFDPVHAELPPLHRPDLAAGPLGGRGLILLRRFTTGLEYERRDGHNRLVLRFAN